MYSIKLPPELVTGLWRLREFAGQGPIAAQAKRAIADYIDAQQEELSAILREQPGNIEECD